VPNAAIDISTKSAPVKKGEEEFAEVVAHLKRMGWIGIITERIQIIYGDVALMDALSCRGP
jgi:hypothetical protein